MSSGNDKIKIICTLRDFPSGVPRPIVTSWISHPAFNFSRSIPFVIDTGSPYTIISPQDAELLKINFKNLDGYKGREIRGISGKLETKRIRVLKKVTLQFASNRGPYRVPMEDILVIKGYIGPSLLGSDFFELTGFKLEIDFKNRTAAILQP